MRRLGVLAVDVAFLAALIDRAIAERKLLGEMNHDVDTPAAAWQFFESRMRKHPGGND